ncbi:uncharacterized protein AruCF_3537 [Achromobacter ruhlandii]|nr:uncharacterized protein AruCF_3537 [Achromobacter ruhlandii]
MLEDGRWRNDGFLRPNGQARDLFAALLFAWTRRPRLGRGLWRRRLARYPRRRRLGAARAAATGPAALDRALAGGRAGRRA